MEHINDPGEFYGKCSCSCGCTAEFGPERAPIDRDDICDSCEMDCRPGPRTVLTWKERER